MKTYQFTVPVHKANAAFDVVLAHKFGGFTVTQGLGAWVDDEKVLITERVLVYQVTTEDREDLESLVLGFLTEQGEQVGYFGVIGDHELIHLQEGGGA